MTDNDTRPQARRPAAEGVNVITEHDFSNARAKALYTNNWPDNPELRQQYEEGGQCGGCTYFAQLNNDYGICCSPKSKYRTQTVFEHFTCEYLDREGWGAHSFCEKQYRHTAQPAASAGATGGETKPNRMDSEEERLRFERDTARNRIKAVWPLVHAAEAALEGMSDLADTRDELRLALSNAVFDFTKGASDEAWPIPAALASGDVRGEGILREAVKRLAHYPTTARFEEETRVGWISEGRYSDAYYRYKVDEDFVREVLAAHSPLAGTPPSEGAETEIMTVTKEYEARELEGDPYVLSDIVARALRAEQKYEAACTEARERIDTERDTANLYKGQRDEARQQLQKAEAENKTMRGLLAKQMPCHYCGVDEMSKCPHGFPGCSLMDDLMAAEMHPAPAASGDEGGR